MIDMFTIIAVGTLLFYPDQGSGPEGKGSRKNKVNPIIKIGM